MTDTITAKTLVVENENNKLNCNGFTVIHFAPPEHYIDDNFKHHHAILEEDYDRVYLIKNGDENIYVKLTGFLRLPFKYIGDVFTVPATGMGMQEWIAAWIKKYPKTDNETKMAIYTYLKEK